MCAVIHATARRLVAGALPSYPSHHIASHSHAQPHDPKSVPTFKHRRHAGSGTSLATGELRGNHVDIVMFWLLAQYVASFEVRGDGRAWEPGQG
jgi:hypothetical protein